MSIEPDTKDWTWVLTDACPECGLAAWQVRPADVATLVRDSVPAWRDVLQRPDVAVRPEASTWSALEYACHVRDVYRLFDERVRLMLTEDDPEFTNWDQDATAVEQDYARQAPGDVAGSLERNGADLARRLEDVEGGQWDRTGRRGDGSVFTVATLVQYLWHDVRHHLVDVGA
ncbi:DinB family protein [Aeromicrobium sp. CTD01-1L150]|uniref:DinB family protein n=1 Tax=Aeromicrobium sp. CTD01-1L150 TaxID=3341830 RepID=UPI0035BFF048